MDGSLEKLGKYLHDEGIFNEWLHTIPGSLSSNFHISRSQSGSNTNHDLFFSAAPVAWKVGMC